MSSLKAHRPEVHLVAGRSTAAITAEVIEALWDRLATDMTVPNRAIFRKREGT